MSDNVIDQICEIYMKDLPEIINYTNKNDRVVKVLKKELDKYE